MKKARKAFLSILLVISMIFATVAPAMALTITITTDKKETEEEGPAFVALDLVLETDKDSYTVDEEIEYTITLTNNTKKNATDVRVINFLSAGLKTSDGKMTTGFADLAPGESVSKTVYVAHQTYDNYGNDGIATALNVISIVFNVFKLVIGKLFASFLPYMCNLDVDMNGQLLGMLSMAFAYESTGEDADEDPEDPELIDDDKDSVPNYVEELFGSQDDEDDTDGDGLSDYIEIYDICTDPCKIDTDADGVADGDEDTDGDGLKNLRELLLGIDIVKKDTDSDMLSDGDEVDIYGTSPLLFDTDDDGVSDGEEILLGTDPLVKQESFNITRSVDDENIEAFVEIELSGEQVESLSIVPVNNPVFFPENMPGYIGKAFDFSVDGDFESATISFTFDKNLLPENAEPTIFYFNEATQSLEELETTINGNVASATVEHFSTYILIDRVVYYGSLTWEDTWSAEGIFDGVEIVLVIDDSGSLGGDYGYSSSTGFFLGGNDPQHMRLSAARNFVENSTNKAKIGIVKFDSSIKTMSNLLECSDSNKELLTNILQITPNSSAYFDSRGSTYMYSGIDSAFDLFSNVQEETENILRAVVVFTDGIAHDEYMHSSVIAEANNRGIRIYTVGLGNSSSYFTDYLRPLATQTGGAFYVTANADQLVSIYDDISKKIDLETDTDGDTIPDYYEDNMIAFNGVKIPLDKTKIDTDGDEIPDNEEVKVELVYNEDKTKVYVKGMLLSHPSLVDSDYDGTIDSRDAAPFNNYFTGKLTSEYFNNSAVSTLMDYRWFFNNNTIYNAELSKLSLLFSSVIYKDGALALQDNLNTRKTNGKTVESVMSYFGMNKPITYKLEDTYSDYHLTDVAIGYHNAVVEDNLKTIVAITIRGTNGKLPEWASNFDLGDISTYTGKDDWVNKDNHKGFDITATRVERIIANYISENSLDPNNLIYWVTGHSRGAGIANIIGANLEKAGKKSFTYTFASPNTTLAKDASSYKSIFNIINEDDFVPYLPFNDWDYTRYGRSTTNVSIKDSYEKTWEKMTGAKDYNPDTFNLQKCVSAMAAMIPNNSDARVACYTYTCSCNFVDHKGNSTNDNITITNKGISANSRNEAIAKVPENARPYCYIHTYDNLLGYHFDMCQTPAYFMQIIAARMGKKIDNIRFAVELNIADRYESAKTAIIAANFSGIEHPHYIESYYVLANNISGASFS